MAVVAEPVEGPAAAVAAPVEFVPCTGFALGAAVRLVVDLQGEVGRHQEVLQVAVAAVAAAGSLRTGTAREEVVVAVPGQDRPHPPMVAWVVHRTNFPVAAAAVAEVRLGGAEAVAGQVHILVDNLEVVEGSLADLEVGNYEHPRESNPGGHLGCCRLLQTHFRPPTWRDPRSLKKRCQREKNVSSR